MHTKFTSEQLEGEWFTINDLAVAINELCEAIDALQAEVDALKSR